MFGPTGLAFRVRVGRGPQVSRPAFLLRPGPVLGVCLGVSPRGSRSSGWGRADPSSAPGVTAHSPPPQDKEVTEILATAGSVVTLTIIPTVIYEHMVKK